MSTSGVATLILFARYRSSGEQQCTAKADLDPDMWRYITCLGELDQSALRRDDE
jgi:hypothetical protein